MSELFTTHFVLPLLFLGCFSILALTGLVLMDVLRERAARCPAEPAGRVADLDAFRMRRFN